MILLVWGYFLQELLSSMERVFNAAKQKKKNYLIQGLLSLMASVHVQS